MIFKSGIIVLLLLIVHILALPMDRTTGNPSTSGRYQKKNSSNTINKQAFKYIQDSYNRVQEKNGHKLRLCPTELREASEMCKIQSGNHSPEGFHRKSYLEASHTLLQYANREARSEAQNHIHVCENCKQAHKNTDKQISQ